jgi:regulatory protein
MQLALQYLSYKDHSVQRLGEKLLAKGVSDTDVAIVLGRLMEYGYLDDERVATQWTESLLKQGYGEHRIKQDLIKKGLDTETAEQLAMSEEESDTAMRLDALVIKLNKGKPFDFKEKQRLYGALCRRGFDYDDIRQALNRFATSEEDWE